MRTTININDAILRELREQARNRDCSFREVVEKALSLGLSQWEKADRKTRFRVKPHDVGIKPGFRGVSLNQLYDQLEAEETLTSP